MDVNFVSIGLGFLEGIALIVSPCILPILPIILAGSVGGSKRRSFGIIIGFVLVFSLFTFFSRSLVRVSGIDTNAIRYASYFILTALGVVMISSKLTEKFTEMTSGLLSVGANAAQVNDPQGGLWGGVLFGGLIAIIWTPCAGPIFAAVIVQTVLQQSNVAGLLTLMAFSLGVAVPMLAIALFGRSIMSRTGFIKKHTRLFRQSLGVIIILSVGYMIAVERGYTITFAGKTTVRAGVALEDGLLVPYPAPPIAGISDWINSPPLKISDLKGKVVLIDFWTYSCINCIRTLPYIKDWYAKYHDKGLVIIGIHTPEFDFEKNLANVKAAVKQRDIQYPVALDNQFVTWRSFENRYWPAHYLIDKEGKVVYTHFGEGAYDVTENNIRYLLGINNKLPAGVEKSVNVSQLTPETYFGYSRAANFVSPEEVKRDAVSHYTIPTKLARHEWALSGQWRVMRDRAVAESKDAAVEINFHARHVYVVMGNMTDHAISARILLNKQQPGSEISVDKHNLYSVVALDSSQDGNLQIIASEPGLEVYTFTFGG